MYDGGLYASATLSGRIRNVTSGEVARLYAQPFPYDRAPSPAGSMALHPAGTTARYMFGVSPSLATRYQVELFRDAAATSPLASSRVTTVYVTLAPVTPSSQSCPRPVCFETLVTHVFVPPSALRTEMAKPWYTYFNLALAPVNEPAPPTLLKLGAGNAHVGPSEEIAGNEFEFVTTFSFEIGTDAFFWRWTKCTKDTLATDGIGLPGSHGCGAASVRTSQSYLG